MATFYDIMSGVSEELTASIKLSRAAVEHRGAKGGAVESAARNFLRDHLPDSIGIAHGEVIDRQGDTSSQLDVILYDAQKTPILFSDKEEGNRVVPVEGVIAAIEVKTNLQTKDIPKLAESARKLKSLDRSAYYRQPNPIITETTEGFGESWDVLPPMYFILGFDGPEMSTLASTIARECRQQPLQRRIDMACVIQRGLVANSKEDGSGLNALSFVGSRLAPTTTEHSLLLFYILMSRYLLQVSIPPISIQSYVPNELQRTMLNK